MSLFKKYKTFEEMLPDFLLEKEMEVNSRSSLAYFGHTGVFLSWLKKNGYGSLSMRKITPDMVSAFFIYLGKGKKLDKPTCEKYFLHLRLVFKYAIKRGEIESIPFDLVTFPRKQPSKSAEVIRPEHLGLLLSEIKKVDPQLFLACMIEYYCFIRPGKELRLLRMGDIDIDNGVITVRQENAKNNKRQLVTMPTQLIDLCIECGIDKADKNLYIFGKSRHFGYKSISSNNLPHRFDVIRDSLGLPQRYKLYSFKHTGASALHQSGISMRELMDQLRHTRLEATQHYLQKHTGLVNTRIRDSFPSPVNLE